MGTAARQLVKHHDWDASNVFLRCHNEWFYTFGFNKINHVTYLDALVNLQGADYIYTGTLVEFAPGPADTIISITLADAARSTMIKLEENPDTEVFTPIRSGLFYIPFSSVKNLNIRIVDVNSLAYS